MSTIRHHAEWLSLIEVSGPFLSLPVLMKVFPQWLEAHNSEVFQNAKRAYEVWDINKTDTATRYAWIKYLLSNVLEYPDEVIAEGQAIPPALSVFVAQQHETLHPDIVIKNPSTGDNPGKPRILIQSYRSSQDLEKPVFGSHWKASPATRMMELLHGTDIPLGLVTNGERWMLVFAPREETTGFASWYADLWFEEQINFVHSVLCLELVDYSVFRTAKFLNHFLLRVTRISRKLQINLVQVRRAVEVLVQTLDRIDQERKRTLLQGIPEATLYEAALTVMMRLVFLFSAEERGLLLLGHNLYDEFYAVSTLSAQLRETADQHGEEILERRNDAWSRLLATFRAVFVGEA